MRHSIETAPRDGKVIILEDDAIGTYDVAHWSPEAGEWVGENGERSKITPTHWYPMLRDKYLLQAGKGSSNPSPVSRARRRLSASSITATLIAVALTGLYFRTEVAVYVTRSDSQQDMFKINTIGRQIKQATEFLSHGLEQTYLLALGQQAEADHASAQAEAQEAVQVARGVERSAQEARQSLAKEPGPDLLANELAEPRRAVNGVNPQLRAGAENSVQLLGQELEKTAALAQDATAARQALTASLAQHRRALEEEPARNAVLAGALAMARREIETQAALVRKAGDDAAQFKQTLERTTAEQQQERDRADGLSRELAIARREIGTNLTLLNAARDDAAKFKQTAERPTAEPQQERDNAEALSRELATARREIQTNAALLNKARDDAAKFNQTVERMTTERQQERASADTVAGELATARREIETNVALLNKARDDAAKLNQTVARTTAERQKERESAEAMARELAMARREIETKVALLNKAHDDAAKFNQTVERTTTERQQERESADAVARELATARREIETNVALLNKVRDDAAKFKQIAERTTAELRQERDRTEALSRELTMAHNSARRTIDVRTTLEPTANSQITQVMQAMEAAAPEQPATVNVKAQGSPEATRLIARASALLGQGDIGAARTVLERAAETGSAQASFMLAETYDPGILSAWGTYGTRGEVTKARELYAKAHAGGIHEAKDRFNALRH
jgi:hypothetical protein